MGRKTSFKLKLEKLKTLNKVKQLLFPKEFRIIPVGLHYDSFKNIEDILNNISRKHKEVPEDDNENEKKKMFYAEVSLGVWRLKKKMIDLQSHQPLEEMNKAYRHLESIMFTLEKEGIEIKDHDGQLFDSGLSIKALAFQPTPGIKAETMIETIKPSVYFMGERIVMGEVIVGTPIK